MVAILDLCKLNMMKGSIGEMVLISVSLAPENIGVDTYEVHIVPTGLR